jgi:conjugative relaxase-like TrwC/TraI family protein
MVATVSPIKDAEGAGVYFYLVENDFEISRSWVQNKASQSLGLKDVKRDDLENVLNGKLSKDVILGRQTEEGLAHRPGYEVIFSAPKSLSILGLVAKDERVIKAHEKAVDSTLSFLQKHSLITRIQEDGKKRIEYPGNALISKFTHFTSRPTKDNEVPDPQIHSHCLIANATLCQDNKWRSIEFEKLYKDQMLLGELYRMELGREVEKLGYGIDKFKDEKSGRQTFEIEGVSKESILEFSKRRQEILEAAEELGNFDSKALDILAHRTREDKGYYETEDLEKSWESRIDKKEFLTLKEQALKKEKAPLSKDGREMSNVLKGALSHLTEREAVFKKEELYHALHKAENRCLSTGELDTTIQRALQKGKIRMSRDGESYTTPQAIKMEKELLNLLKDSQNTVSPIEKTHVIKDSLQNTKLTQGQKEAISLVMETKDRVVGIQGAAGTGKTTALKELKTLLKEKNITLMAVAPSKEAARVLKDEVGLSSSTLQSLLVRHEGFIKGRGTDKAFLRLKENFNNTVLVCDESSLAGTRQMTELLTLSKQANLRLVLLGDKKQLSGVEAGKPFHLLQNNGLHTAFMSTILRQKNTDLKKAVMESQKAVDGREFFSKLKIKKAFEFLKDKNIHEIKGQDKDGLPAFTSNEELAEGAYKLWKELKNKGKDALLVAPSHDLRHYVNQRVRQELIKGKSQSHEVFTGKNMTQSELFQSKNYKKGDVVIFHKTLKECNIKKDEIYRVEKTKDGQIHLLTTRGESRVFNPKTKEGFCSLYKTDNLPLAKDERICFTKNSSVHSFITNGSQAQVLSLTKNKVKLMTENHGIQSLSTRDSDFKHIDHAYSMTAFASQGKTVDSVIGILRSKESHIVLSHQRSFYVSLSRARYDAFVVTDNKERLIQSLSEKTGAKTSALEMIKAESKEKVASFNHQKTKERELIKQAPPSKEKGGIEFEF